MVPARLRPALLLPLLVAAAGCGSDSPAASGPKVAVRAGDSSCEVSSLQLQPGSTVLAVTNTGRDTTEVYVYGKGDGGAYDKVVGEVENVAPGTSRDFSVDLTGGTYEVACKPGQTGNGIRTPVTVAGPAASAQAAYDREVEVEAKEYAFSGLQGFTAKAGEKIEFKLENPGTMPHELEVLGPDGQAVGEVGPTEPGKDGEVVLTLSAPGTYTYLCGIGDHAQRGMKGTFTVA